MMKLFIKDVKKLLWEGYFASDNNVEKVIELILVAINDWPNTIDNFNDYEVDVQSFIMNITIKKNIENTLSNIDFSKHAWQAESLSELVEIYDYFEEGVSFKEIINQIQQLMM